MEMIEKNYDLIEFEQAKLLRKLGFDEPCVRFYNIDGVLDFYYKHTSLPITDKIKNSDLTYGCTAPTFIQIKKWMQEVHGIIISAIVAEGNLFISLVILSEHKYKIFWKEILLISSGNYRSILIQQALNIITTFDNFSKIK